MKLSALVCARDQEADLSDCLRRLWFCDEIVVVADRCKDATAEIARRHGARVVAGAFPLESQRRAAGLLAATGDWILEIEPDERVESALAWEIRASLKSGLDGDHFALPVVSYLGDRRVRGGWRPRRPLEARLYRPGVKRWADRPWHPGQTKGRAAGALKGELRRVAAHSTADLLRRFEAASDREAEDLAEQPRQPGLVGAVGRGSCGFARSYVAAAGWRDGGLGLLVASLAALLPLVTRLKARELVSARAEAAAQEPRAAGDVVRLSLAR